MPVAGKEVGQRFRMIGEFGRSTSKGYDVPEYDYRRDPTVGEIERRIVRTNLRRTQPLLVAIIVLTALILAGSYLLRGRAVNDFGSIGPFQIQVVFRSLWLVADLIIFFAIRSLLRRPEQTTRAHVIAETGCVLVNMLFVVALVVIGYTYNPSLEVLYIALFALVPVIRLSFIKSLIAIGLPCVLLLAALPTLGATGVAHISNIISLVAITVLAMIVFRLMFLSTVRELMQQSTIQHQLAIMGELAGTDDLTKIANRRRLNEHLEMEWRRSLRERSALAVIMIDIDFFKRFNDLYGHMAGDDCLQSVARIISRYARRPGDMAARYGGEEFVMLLPHADLDHAALTAEKIRQDVFAMGRLHADSPEKRVTVSLGVAATGPAVGSEADLLQSADQALYRAKASGRNRVAFAAHDAGMGTCTQSTCGPPEDACHPENPPGNSKT